MNFLRKGWLQACKWLIRGKYETNKFDEVQKKLNDVFDNAGTKETGFKGEKPDENFQEPAVSYTTKTSDGDYSIITVDWNTMIGTYYFEASDTDEYDLMIFDRNISKYY